MAFFYSFFQLKEKDKIYIYIFQKEWKRENISIFCWQLESVVSPLNKSLKIKSLHFGQDLVWHRYTLTLLLSQYSCYWLPLPIIWRVFSCLLHDELIQSYYMLPYSRHLVVILFKESKPESTSLRCLLTYFSIGHPWFSMSWFCRNFG